MLAELGASSDAGALVSAFLCLEWLRAALVDFQSVSLTSPLLVMTFSTNLMIPQMAKKSTKQKGQSSRPEKLRLVQGMATTNIS